MDVMSGATPSGGLADGGQKRMRTVGRVNIPQKAFGVVLEPEE
jgi:translation elongation factor EF-4